MRPRSIACAVAAIVLATSAPPASAAPALQSVGIVTQFQVDRARFVLVRDARGVSISDERTRTAYHPRLDADCQTVAVHVPDLLLSCASERPYTTAPAVLDLTTNVTTRFPASVTDSPDPGFSSAGYSELGAAWLAGNAEPVDPVHGPDGVRRVYLNRTTLQRVVAYADAPRDLDDPRLRHLPVAPDACRGSTGRLRHRLTDARTVLCVRARRDGGLALVLHRRGHGPVVLVDSPRCCDEWRTGPRFVAWALNDGRIALDRLSDDRRFAWRVHPPPGAPYGLGLELGERHLFVTVPVSDPATLERTLYRARLPVTPPARPPA